jgi:pyrroline-5-carboxylate reductase
LNVFNCLDKYTSIIGSGSGFCYSIFEMYKQSSEALELDDSVNTQELIMNIFSGSIHLLKESQQSFKKQKQDVITPNGTTHAGLQSLEKCSGYFDKTIFDAYKRAEEFGNEMNNSLKN